MTRFFIKPVFIVQRPQCHLIRPSALGYSSGNHATRSATQAPRGPNHLLMRRHAARMSAVELRLKLSEHAVMQH